jgi:hypothetical protein
LTSLAEVNRRRLLESIGNIPLAEVEDRLYAVADDIDTARAS